MSSPSPNITSESSMGMVSNRLYMTSADEIKSMTYSDLSAFCTTRARRICASSKKGATSTTSHENPLCALLRLKVFQKAAIELCVEPHQVLLSNSQNLLPFNKSSLRTYFYSSSCSTIRVVPSPIGIALHPPFHPAFVLLTSFLQHLF